ncbi:family 20 glycosylhydrolase [Sphingomonas sp. KR1UV-12]|uniref:beta-N-acetylhexosaminidase n=1 Tax=Sphingomonas aurea TaxID=3063994 RepID=A0ABT9ELH3_9SPHN|nr:family 20 glycosylhydrolase [Sphingomonas sp. KR1UV-12]MDP1027646.1 family 20 glycosylhydrolase [Sphingomonas sp. KR1UV-12]
MDRRGARIAGLALLVSATVAGQAVAQHGPVALPLIPMPASIESGSGSFTVTAGTTVDARTRGAATAARLLIERVQVTRGIALVRAAGGAIRIERDRSVRGDEAYRLTVTPRGIRIAASTDAGLVHGAMTLAQLLAPDAAFGRPVAVPALAIADAPRFRWRGYMADVARHFQPIAALKTTIDQMAALKLNTLHLHLSDDHGWRVEIRKYPELTRIGAWRTPLTGGGPPPAQPYGGFYTQAELRDLVAYAAERAITIVPEIDLPGHAQAIVASYPELGVFGDRPVVSGDWGVNPYLLDPGPKGVAFVKDVIDELLSIFPGRYIHLGGDEAIKDQWQRSPRVQALMRERGIATENALQSALIREFDAYLRARGRRLIGWDEILEGGGLPQSAVVMSWQGEKGAIEAAREGHDVVLSPAPILYLDNLQSWLPDEPPMRPANPPMTLARVYDYDAMPAAIAPADRDHVLGAQMNAWSEYLTTPERAWYATFPRLAAFAEGVWSPGERRDFDRFLDRLEPQAARWRREGVPAADTAFAVAYTLQGTRSDAVTAKRARVALANQTGHGTIRYTLDGTAPTTSSPTYAAPLDLPLGTTVQATPFGADGQPLAKPRSYAATVPALLTTDSVTLQACRGGIELRLPLTPDQVEAAPAYSSNIFDDCMTWRQAPLSVADGYTIAVARLPRNFGIAHDFKKLKSYYAATRYGELVVRAGGCEGTPVGTFPLPDPATAPNRFEVSGRLPRGTADGDLCMTFTAPVTGPLYAVGQVALAPAR